MTLAGSPVGSSSPLSSADVLLASACSSLGAALPKAVGAYFAEG
jgi:hypothetical protein